MQRQSAASASEPARKKMAKNAIEHAAMIMENALLPCGKPDLRRNCSSMPLPLPPCCEEGGRRSSTATSAAMFSTGNRTRKESHTCQSATGPSETEGQTAQSTVKNEGSSAEQQMNRMESSESLPLR